MEDTSPPTSLLWRCFDCGAWIETPTYHNCPKTWGSWEQLCTSNIVVTTCLYRESSSFSSVIGWRKGKRCGFNSKGVYFIISTFHNWLQCTNIATLFSSLWTNSVHLMCFIPEYSYFEIIWSKNFRELFSSFMNWKAKIMPCHFAITFDAESPRILWTKI